MFMIYIDVIESANKSDSFLYYKSSTNYGNSFPCDEELKNEVVLTQSEKVFDICKSKGIDAKFLHLCLGFKSPLGLYEIFSYFFEGKVENDFNMIEAIFNGLLLQSDYCFCLKIGNSFCWFSVKPTELKVLGSMQLCHVMNKYNTGQFMKRLRYEIAKMGYNLDRVKWLVWDETDIKNEFANYIFKYDMLCNFFSEIEGFKGLGCKDIMKILSHEVQDHFELRANVFVSCLKDSFSSLGLYEKDGVLYSGTTYYKDFSSCVSTIIDSRKLSWGIIIDCEGKKGLNGSLSNGFREMGGIIYCRYNNTLLNASTFICDEVMLSETLDKVLTNYKELSGLPTNKPINVIVYGSSDKIMFFSSLNSVCSKVVKSKVERRFKFTNCSMFIKDYLGVSNIPTLEDVAKKCKVSCLKPAHNPLNDCRTLFNVLARILLESNDFVV